MAALTKEAFKNTKGFKLVEVDMPDWDASVMLKSLSGRERVDLASKIGKRQKEEVTAEDGFKYQLAILAVTIANPDGTRMFTDEEIEEAMSEKSAESVDRLTNEAMKLNGLGVEQANEAAESLESRPRASILVQVEHHVRYSCIRTHGADLVQGVRGIPGV